MNSCSPNALIVKGWSGQVSTRGFHKIKENLIGRCRRTVGISGDVQNAKEKKRKAEKRAFRVGQSTRQVAPANFSPDTMLPSTIIIFVWKLIIFNGLQNQ